MAVEGTVTDPRNSLLMKFFNLIDVGERSGRGVYEIYQVWAGMKWDTPSLNEMLDADRTRLTLPIKKVAIKSGDKKVAIKSGDKNDTPKTKKHKERILSYIKEHGEITSGDASDLLHIGISRSKVILSQLVDSGEISAQGDNKNRSYILKKDNI